MKRYIVKIINKIKKVCIGFIYKKEINKLIEIINKQGKDTILFLNVVDWNIPLFQRPQHIAKCMANEGYNYLFFTGNVYDNVKTYEKKEEGLYIVNAIYWSHIRKKLNVPNKYIHLYSTDMGTTNQKVDDYIQQGYRVLYEYIDEISSDLYGSEIPKGAWEKHKRMLKDIHIYVVCTARKLYNEAFAIRSDNKLALITNGVDYDHFQQDIKECPVKNIVNKGRPIIGYFGAFASWFDYEMIAHLAESRPDYEILLIGWKYDDSMEKSKLDIYNNVHIIGPISYDILPSYAQWFDVATIPFKLNDITDSTSPIKLFEYMALNKPIVTTDMPECRLYQSVMIAKDIQDFVYKVDEALAVKKDKEYINMINKEALDNTWKAKARDIVELLGKEREKNVG